MAARARSSPLLSVWNRGEKALFDEEVPIPAAYHAAVSALANLSPATLRDESAARDWLELLEFGHAPIDPGTRAQLDLADGADRRAAYRDITVPLLAMAFADDLRIPPYLTREVADCVPGATYVEIADAGHFGYLERPAETNRALLEFLRG
jgi:pimeloyl-ACP methyl ester carboxylesterase